MEDAFFSVASTATPLRVGDDYIRQFIEHCNANPVKVWNRWAVMRPDVSETSAQPDGWKEHFRRLADVPDFRVSV